MRRHVLAASDAMGLAREERWYAGEGWTPVLRAAQPQPKRRALAMADAKPELTAEQVSQAFAAAASRPGSYGAPPALDAVGFDEMLPEMPSHHVLPYERADLYKGNGRHRWVAPYFATIGQPDTQLTGLLGKAQQGERLTQEEVERLFRSDGADL